MHTVYVEIRKHLFIYFLFLKNSLMAQMEYRFNFIGNLSAITTPIVIGYIISTTGSFKWALVFVGANALVAVFSYLVIVGPIKRVVLKEPPSQGPELTHLTQAHS